MNLHTSALFLGQWLRAPLQTGAVLPSGSALVKSIARELDPQGEGLVVELGPGTGAVTKALLDRGVRPERLVLVERNAEFAALLRRRFPEVAVLRADASDLDRVLADAGFGYAQDIVSSLPLRSLPFSVQRRVLRSAFRVLVPGGRLLQFTYGFSSPVHPVLQERLRLTGHSVSRVLFNLPPAVVWSYTPTPAESGDRLEAVAAA
jgi:phosphatidylethanolamine/phosphatidyl-N-methylethanolamine N-methyltransferase